MILRETRERGGGCVSLSISSAGMTVFQWRREKQRRKWKEEIRGTDKKTTVKTTRRWRREWHFSRHPSPATRLILTRAYIWGEDWHRQTFHEDDDNNDNNDFKSLHQIYAVHCFHVMHSVFISVPHSLWYSVTGRLCSNVSVRIFLESQELMSREMWLFFRLLPEFLWSCSLSFVTSPFITRFLQGFLPLFYLLLYLLSVENKGIVSKRKCLDSSHVWLPYSTLFWKENGKKETQFLVPSCSFVFIASSSSFPVSLTLLLVSSLLSSCVQSVQ